MLENIKSSAKNLKTIQGLTLCGLLTALFVVLGYIKFYITPSNRVSFTFIATVLSSIILGPVPALIVGALGDIVSYIVFPTGGAYFFGYTITTALTGFVYGLFLYKKPSNRMFLFIVTAQLVVTVLLNVTLNSLWNSIFSPKAIYFLIISSAVKNVILFPIQITIIFTLAKTLEKTGLKNKYC